MRLIDGKIGKIGKMGVDWTRDDDAKLRVMSHSGVEDLVRMSVVLKRNCAGVRNRLKELGLPIPEKTKGGRGVRVDAFKRRRGAGGWVGRDRPAQSRR